MSTCSEDSATITLEGEVTVNNIAEISRSLTVAVAGSRVVTLNVTGVQEIDVAGIQLFLAAERAAAAAGRQLSFRSPLPAALTECFDLAGFRPSLVCEP